MLPRVVLAAAVAAAFVTSASAATVSYTAKLSGRSEVPKVDTKGSGKLDATLDTASKELKYTLTFEGLSGPATGAHFHGPATRTQTAGVITPIGGGNPASPVTGSIVLTDQQLKELKSGKMYANIHTTTHPAGEIRGQVLHAKAKKPATTATAPAATAPAATAPAATAPAK
ncbi:MAG: CHRD domain-containing protein [Rhodopila sp.]